LNIKATAWVSVCSKRAMQNVHDSGSPSPREVVNAPVNLGHVPMSRADLRAQTEAVTGTISEPSTRDEFGARALQAFEEAITQPAGRPPGRCMRRGSKGTMDGFGEPCCGRSSALPCASPTSRVAEGASGRSELSEVVRSSRLARRLPRNKQEPDHAGVKQCQDDCNGRGHVALLFVSVSAHAADRQARSQGSLIEGTQIVIAPQADPPDMPL
jgi:hypothetical protein